MAQEHYCVAPLTAEEIHHPFRLGGEVLPGAEIAPSRGHGTQLGGNEAEKAQGQAVGGLFYAVGGEGGRAAVPVPQVGNHNGEPGSGHRFEQHVLAEVELVVAEGAPVGAEQGEPPHLGMAVEVEKEGSFVHVSDFKKEGVAGVFPPDRFDHRGGLGEAAFAVLGVDMAVDVVQRQQGDPAAGSEGRRRENQDRQERKDAFPQDFHGRTPFFPSGTPDFYFSPRMSSRTSMPFFTSSMSAWDPMCPMRNTFPARGP